MLTNEAPADLFRRHHDPAPGSTQRPDLINCTGSVMVNNVAPLRVDPYDMDVLRARGIDPAVAAERGVFTATRPGTMENHGFSGAQRRVPALLIPTHRPGGKDGPAVSRPHNPRIDHRGKTLKYEMPAKHPPVIDVPVRVRDRVVTGLDELWITEGPLKCDSAVSHGLVCIALAGAWTFARTPELLTDWECIPLRGRTIVIAFDSDAFTNWNVANALHRLAAFLEQRGADVYIAPIPEPGR